MSSCIACGAPVAGKSKCDYCGAIQPSSKVSSKAGISRRNDNVIKIEIEKIKSSFETVLSTNNTQYSRFSYALKPLSETLEDYFGNSEITYTLDEISSERLEGISAYYVTSFSMIDYLYSRLLQDCLRDPSKLSIPKPDLLSRVKRVFDQLDAAQIRGLKDSHRICILLTTASHLSTVADTLLANAFLYEWYSRNGQNVSIDNNIRSVEGVIIIFTCLIQIEYLFRLNIAILALEARQMISEASEEEIDYVSNYMQQRSNSSLLIPDSTHNELLLKGIDSREALLIQTKNILSSISAPPTILACTPVVKIPLKSEINHSIFLKCVQVAKSNIEEMSQYTTVIDSTQEITGIKFLTEVEFSKSEFSKSYNQLKSLRSKQVLIGLITRGLLVLGLLAALPITIMATPFVLALWVMFGFGQGILEWFVAL